MSDEAIALSEAQLRAELARQVEMAGGQARWAARHAVTRSQVCQALNGSRGISQGILNAMGLMRVDRYVPAKRRNEPWPSA
ncbi:MAG: hypothetical protein IRZ07_03870 [Microbispora sp.]|nr:hypothetical protein [Microbispora sp.]